MNNSVKKFLIIFAALMIITFALTFGMIALINPMEPNSIFVGIGFFLITFLPLLIGSIWYLQRGLTGNTRKEKQLLETGKQAPATVLDVADTGITMNSIYPVVRLTLKVTPSLGDAPFEAQIEALVSRVNIPRPGDQIEVVYNPENHKEIVIKRGG